MANEESSAFSKDDDIGNVTSHQIEIYLNDKTLVQQNYNSIRITLYDELKNYTESLLNITSCNCQKERWIITTLLRLPQSEFKDHNRRTNFPGYKTLLTTSREVKFSVHWIRATLTTFFTLTQTAENAQNSLVLGVFMNGSGFHLVL